MGPGAPGFARVSSMNSTGKLALAHATRKYKREASLVVSAVRFGRVVNRHSRARVTVGRDAQ